MVLPPRNRAIQSLEANTSEDRLQWDIWRTATEERTLTFFEMAGPTFLHWHQSSGESPEGGSSALCVILSPWLHDIMKRFAILLTALFLVLALPSEAQPQTSLQIGPRVGMDVGDIEEPFVGLDARITSVRLPLVINPTFDYYFVGENTTFWSLSGNLLYPFGADDRAFTFYAGAGLGIYRFSVEGNVPNLPFREGTTDVGANFLLGTMISSRPFSPYAALRYTPIFSDGSPTLFGLEGGILIRF